MLPPPPTHRPALGVPRLVALTTLVSLAVVAVLLAVVPGPARAADPAPITAAHSSLGAGRTVLSVIAPPAPRVRAVIRLVNRVRQHPRTCGDERFGAQGPLRPNLLLSLAAQQYALRLSLRDVLAHVEPDGTDPADRIHRTGYRARSWGENLAAGQATPATVMRAWLRSPGHCANIMGRFTQIGVGFVHRPGSRYGTYWVQDFGSPR